MEAYQYSRTALMAAFIRNYHHQHDLVKIFDDPLAGLFLLASDIEWIENGLLTIASKEAPELVLPNKQETLSRFLRWFSPAGELLSRAKYAEDHVLGAIGRGITQYVLIGAGLETFAFRNPGLQTSVQIFEVDHPATQAFKRDVMSRTGYLCLPNLHFVAADLEIVTPADALKKVSFDAEMPSVFSWLGVIPYLTLQAFRQTLRSIRSVMAPGSLLIFNYLDGDAFRPERVADAVSRLIEMTKGLGEPLMTGFDPAVMLEELASAGFDLVEDIDPEEQKARYFSGQLNGYHAMEHNHFACVTPMRL